ncbi:MAG: adenosylcobinamide-phosphate synthase CbiB [Tannerellaceae bacterium]|nr:adenosylcobinamide-phosphate synthase CbiB [Tannerellaceae bacterium]
MVNTKSVNDLSCGEMSVLPLLMGWMADRWLGDPRFPPHPVVGFGRVIAWGEKRLNKGRWRRGKGALFAVVLIAACFLVTAVAERGLADVHGGLAVGFVAVCVFYCLSGKTLVDEVRRVFVAVDASVEAGRRQVARIVGRDTGELSAQQVRTAALESLSENLSDGVVAPLFWFMLLGAPGMAAYKMANTLDSMVGYKDGRYRRFGCWAARIDDVANYVPARLTAGLMILLGGRLSLLAFVAKEGGRHASPNAGYPEAALAGLLDCRFGGPAGYFGVTVDKPYIGDNPRALTAGDMETAAAINRRVEAAMMFLAIGFILLMNYIQR